MNEKEKELRKLLDTGKKHLWHPLLQHKLLEKQDLILFEKGNGIYLTDYTGKQYIDAFSGLWCVNIGYGREPLAEAAYQQMKKLPYYPFSQLNIPAINLAEKLSNILPAGLERIFFANSGSEAVETALKISRQSQRQRFPGESRFKFIARYKGYHGFTMGALSATGQTMRKAKFEPLVPGFIHVHPPYCFRCGYGKTYPECNIECATNIQEIIRHEDETTIAAVIAEPIIGGGGVITPPDEYFPILREICHQHNVLLIFDEVITGFGRTGKPFACMHWDVTPDIMTLAKGISSAYLPLAACVTTQEVFERFLGDVEEAKELAQVSTFGSHAVSCATACANLDIIINEKLWDNARDVGKYLMEKLMEFKDLPVIGEIRGKGLIIGIEFVKEGKIPADEKTMAKIVKDLREKGVIVGRNTYTVKGFANVIFIAPPLIVTRAEADIIIKAIKSTIESI